MISLLGSPGGLEGWSPVLVSDREEVEVVTGQGISWPGQGNYTLAGEQPILQ